MPNNPKNPTFVESFCVACQARTPHKVEITNIGEVMLVCGCGNPMGTPPLGTPEFDKYVAEYERVNKGKPGWKPAGGGWKNAEQRMRFEPWDRGQEENKILDEFEMSGADAFDTKQYEQYQNHVAFQKLFPKASVESAEFMAFDKGWQDAISIAWVAKFYDLKVPEFIAEIRAVCKKWNATIRAGRFYGGDDSDVSIGGFSFNLDTERDTKSEGIEAELVYWPKNSDRVLKARTKPE